MTLAEAFRVFDSIRPLDPKMQDLSAPNANLGVPICCGLPVVMPLSSHGPAKIYCLHCRRMITEIAGQWIVTEWGEKGIKMPGGINADTV